jgi:hypothetical protein
MKWVIYAEMHDESADTRTALTMIEVLEITRALLAEGFVFISIRKEKR